MAGYPKFRTLRVTPAIRTGMNRGCGPKYLAIECLVKKGADHRRLPKIGIYLPR